MKKFYFLLFAMLSFNLAAQPIIIDNGYTAEEMVNDFFNNDTITISNVQSQCDPMSMAFFHNENPEIGVSTGIVLSTGDVSFIPMPAGFFASINNNLGGDEDISTMIGGNPSFDATFLEFDFVASETIDLDFSYIFASEEYPEFVGSQFNDAFAFYLSGPGYAGPYSNNSENIAVLPNNALEEVSINSVNQFTNSEFFVEYSNGPNVTYDGFTTMLPAAFTAQKDEVYHIKIVVSDVSDHIYDSAVFLGYNSLGNLDSLVPPAEFSFTTNANELIFNNESKYAATYSWDFGNGKVSSDRYPEMVEYDETGEYEVQLITQNYCCTDTMKQMVQVTSLQPLAGLPAVLNHVSCYGKNDAKIQMNISGGVEPYTVNWYPEITDLDMVSPGDYSYEILDAEGELVSGNILVTEPSELTSMTSSIEDLDNQGQGAASVVVDGGTDPYSYLWSNDETTEAISNLVAGIYSVTITDDNGCIQIEEVEVAASFSLAASISVNNNPLLCFGDTNASIDVNVTGGNEPYQVTWSPNADLANLPAGTYSFVITDADGEQLEETIEIFEPTLLETSASSTDSDEGLDNGSAEVEATGGTESYTYLWSNGEKTQKISNLPAGPYTVVVTDANGCESIQEVVVNSVVSIFNEELINLESYPNPAVNFVQIGFQTDDIKAIKVFNLAGENFTPFAEYQNDKIQLNIEALSSGLYFVEIQSASTNTSSYGKFIKN